jgi:tRNA(Ile)-lysidine synthase
VSVLETVRRTINWHHMFDPGETLVVGVSGGPDSLCLLHVLRELGGEYEVCLHVAHLDHQIRGQESAADAAFVAQVAKEWGIPATIAARDVPAYARERHLAIEEAARQARYAFLAQVAQEVGTRKVAVAHNADDQVESVLMHFLRGAGLAGLRGMRSLSPWPSQPVTEPPLDLILLRPLLEVPRTEIEAYCRQHHLQPRFDRSNLDTTYYRNRLRHELIPLLETYNPGVRQVLRRAAKVVADDYEYLREQGRHAWEGVVTEADDTFVFALEPWQQLHPSLQRQLLREAIRRLRRGLRNINWVHIEDALMVLNERPTGSIATLPQRLQLFKGYESFTVGETRPRPDLPLLTVERLPLTVPGVTPLPESEWRVETRILSRGELTEEHFSGADPWQTALDYDRAGPELALRRRRPGDRFQPLGLGGRAKAVSEFMINEKIPAHIRDEFPLIVSPRHIVWIPGWRLDERVKITPDIKHVLWLSFSKEALES